MYVSGRSGWPDSSPQICVDSIAGNSLNRCLTSLAGSEPPYTSPFSMNNAGDVEELTGRNYGIPNRDVVSSSDSREGMNSKLGRWQHLYQLAAGSRSKSPHGDSVSRDKDHMIFSVREDLRIIPSDIRDQKHLLSKRMNQDPEEISAHLTDGYNKIISNNTLLLGGPGSRALSSSSFSQFFVKKALKGKGVMFRNQEARAGNGVAAVCQNDETPAYVTGVASEALVNSSANNNRCSSHIIDKFGPEPSYDGISLREWLKLGCHRLNKVESLDLYKKIVELVDFAHSQGVALQDLRPSCFILLPSKRVKYTGSSAQRELQTVLNNGMNKKRLMEQDSQAYGNLGAKQQKFIEDIKSLKNQCQFTSACGFRSEAINEVDNNVTGLRDSGCTEHKAQNSSSYQGTSFATQQQSISVNDQLEERWYASPEELNERGCTFSANIYRLGVLLFELLCCFESWERHSAAMLDLHQRILPPNILSENPKEASFCLWLLHPEPLSRPTTREILQSDLLCGSQELYTGDGLPLSADDEDAKSELLLHFLISMKEKKQRHASKLVEDLGCLEADIKEVERRNLLRTSSVPSWKHEDVSNAREREIHLEDPVSSCVLSRPFSVSNSNEARLMKSMSQLENAYFSMRSQLQNTQTGAEERSDKDLPKIRERWSQVQNQNEEMCMNKKPTDRLGAFFEGLCKFARYSKFEVCGTLRNGDLLNSANVICSLSFDRDEDYIAAAGVSKKIKIFEFGALLNDTVDIHYPVVEMTTKSKLSCICWNKYIKNYLASTDYDGVIQMWDASTGQGFSQYTEHQKRAWSVDFSQVDPTKFASGSDDCSVKLWSINEKNSSNTIWNPANVCCVQFSAYSTHLLAFGSADYKIYCYDIRHTKIPWCTLAGHGKAVSYVKFIDSETLVSASTDNTLKLWDLNKTSPSALSPSACGLTFSGHTNEKNFVGLSVSDGYIACGSETNEVYTYCRSLPMPITSYKFGSIDPLSGHDIAEDNGQFVSSVCWRGKSNMVVAANSSGTIKLLQMV
ncbi:hypothetical protein L1049_014381 [Liquidambar formosana]|uniref:Protein kinase domain-containing protein n=1 Tax=Liquidambar formosana TaxID=63359 RepID=A0AAP0RMR1_LIQFO